MVINEVVVSLFFQKCRSQDNVSKTFFCLFVLYLGFFHGFHYALLLPYKCESLSVVIIVTVHCLLTAHVIRFGLVLI